MSDTSLGHCSDIRHIYWVLTQLHGTRACPNCHTTTVFPKERFGGIVIECEMCGFETSPPTDMNTAFDMLVS
jgi:ribosomal protein L37AE/L43A